MSAMRERTFVVGSVLLVVALLFFLYPLMTLLQQADPALANVTRFSLTTSRGDVAYTQDIVWDANGAITVAERPGLFLHDTITYEHREEILPIQGTPPFLLHAALYAILQDATATLLLGSIISVVILVLLLFSIAKLIQEKERLRGVIDLRLLLVAAFFTFPYAFVNLLSYLRHPALVRPYLGYVGRFININHIAIFLLLWFSFLLRVLYAQEGVGHGVKGRGAFRTWWTSYGNLLLLGASLALLQYSYVYFYFSALLFTGFAFLVAFPLRSAIRNGLFTFGTWFLLSLPWMYNYLSFSSVIKTMLEIADAQRSNFPSFFPHLLFLFAICLSFILINAAGERGNRTQRLRKAIRASPLAIALFLTALFTLNLPLFLGYTVQAYHWVVAFILPLTILVGFFHVAKLLRFTLARWPKNAKPRRAFLRRVSFVVFAFLALSAVCTVAILSIAAWQWYPYYSSDKADDGLFTFIETQTPPDAVFFADTTYVTDLIRANTQRRTLLGHPLSTRLTKGEINARLRFGYAALGKSEADLFADIDESQRCGSYARIATLKETDRYANCNNLFFYYQGLYHDAGLGAYDSEKLKADLHSLPGPSLPASSSPQMPPLSARSSPSPVLSPPSSPPSPSPSPSLPSLSLPPSPPSSSSSSGETFKLDYLIFTRDGAVQDEDLDVVYRNERYVVKRVGRT